MSTCSVRWRSSGGRGEWEYVPSDCLTDREILISFDPLGVTIPAEVVARNAQGKPRLRKFVSNDRKKFHLPTLVMAVCRLPEPRREDIDHTAHFPLTNKSFLIDSMDFDIVDLTDTEAVLAPLRVSIMHSNYEIDLGDKLTAVAVDFANHVQIGSYNPALGKAILDHYNEVQKAVNDTAIRTLADSFIKLSSLEFGETNGGSIEQLLTYASLPEADIEETLTGTEGRLLTRIHSYRERDRDFVRKVKKHVKKIKGQLHCEGCGLDPIVTYGTDGERCIEAHHMIPIQQLQPDSITREEDIAMLCASCHRIVHSRYPCLSIDELRSLIPAL